MCDIGLISDAGSVRAALAALLGRLALTDKPASGAVRGAQAFIRGAIVSVLAVTVCVAEPPVVALEPWSNVTAGEEVTLRFRLPGAGARDAVGWSVAVERAVIIRRETQVQVNANLPPVLTVKFRLPEGEPKTVLPVSVFVSSSGRQVLAKQLWLYPNDPFQTAIPHLAADQLVLFDPAGDTAQRWREASLSFREQTNVDAIADLESGVLAIGEGVSFREYRGLPGLILQTAARGLKVLCLAPAAGTLILSSDGAAPRPEIVRFTLARADVLTRFDKRLDDRDWRGVSAVGDTTLRLISESDQLSVNLVEDAGGWAWLDAEFSSGGRIVVACFRCIEHWDSGPAPRYTMWHLLSHAARPARTSTRE